MLTLSDSANPNYCMTIVSIKATRTLPGLDNLVATTIMGSDVLVSVSTKPGDIGIFIPAETQLSHDFLHLNNLYSKESRNHNTTVKGYFANNGRVRAITLRGHESNAVFMPLSCLSTWMDVTQITREMVGQSFDTVQGVRLCNKYTVPVAENTVKNKAKKPCNKPTSRLIPGQFELSNDVLHFGRNMQAVNPSDWCTITRKYHGTNFSVGNVLVKCQLTWKEKLAKFFGVPVQDEEYAVIAGSRRVIKDVDNESYAGSSWYGTDIWAYVQTLFKDVLPEGYTVYGELVGYCGTKPIQPGYTYGCVTPQFKIVIFRVNCTLPSGGKIELDHNSMVKFCEKYNMLLDPENLMVIPVIPAECFYQGRVDNIAPEIQHLAETAPDTWRDLLYQLIASRTDWGMNNSDCPLNPGMPSEGVVLTVRNMSSNTAYKIKNPRFLRHETDLLDKAIVSEVESDE